MIRRRRNERLPVVLFLAVAVAAATFFIVPFSSLWV
jgi:hypothetical protein